MILAALFHKLEFYKALTLGLLLFLCFLKNNGFNKRHCGISVFRDIETCILDDTADELFIQWRGLLVIKTRSLPEAEHINKIRIHYNVNCGSLL